MIGNSWKSVQRFGSGVDVFGGMASDRFCRTGKYSVVFVWVSDHCDEVRCY